MKKTKNMLWVLSLMLMCLSCYDDTELLNRIDALEKAQTSTVNNVDEQVKAIKSSIASLTDLQNSLKDQLTSLENQCEALQVAGTEQDYRLSELEKDVMNLTNMVQQIAVMIDSLRSTVNDLLAEQKSWAEATFATLEQHNALCHVLATTKVSLEDMMKGYDEANVAKFAALAGQIQTVETSLKVWVSDQLANYYDIATMDAKLKALEAAISEGDDAAKKEYEELTAQLAALEQAVAAGDEQAAKEHAELSAKLKALEETMGKGDEALKKELAALAASVDAMKQELAAAYQSAIKTAIEENNGNITKKIAEEIESVNLRIDKEIASLDNRLDAIEARVAALEEKVENLLKHVDIKFDESGSIAYSPGSTIFVGYTLTNADESTLVETLAEQGWESEVEAKSSTRGLIKVKTNKESEKGKVLVFVNKGSETVLRVLRFEKGSLTILSDSYSVGPDGETIDVEVETNIDYNIDIPKECESWISVQSITTRSAVRKEVASIEVKPNLSTQARSVIIDIKDNMSNTIKSFSVYQTSNVQPDNEIWYTSTDGNIVKLYRSDVFRANFVSNEIDKYGKGIITFDRSVEVIGENAFYERENLKTISIPETVQEISDRAFFSCKSLQEVCLPQTLQKIGSETFFNCSLIELEIPEGVQKIGTKAFVGCKLKSVTIPSHFDYIGSEWFRGCKELETVNLPKNLKRIYSSAFWNCSNLRNVEIPQSVENIQEEAFYGCTSMKMILPSNLISVGDYAFSNCVCDTMIIPASVQRVGRYCFPIPSSYTVVCKAVNPPSTSYSYVYATESARYLTLLVPKGSSEAYLRSSAWSGFWEIKEFDE